MKQVKTASWREILVGESFAAKVLRDLGDRKLYTIEKPSSYPDLSLLIDGAVNVKQITDHWDELLRLTTSLRLGTVTASLMLRKLASYPRQNGLAWALREVGRIEKTLFTLDLGPHLAGQPIERAKGR